MHDHGDKEREHAVPALTLEAADPMMCVGPDGVHACGGHGEGPKDGICRHSDGTSHGCGDCPNCRKDEPAVAPG